MWTEAPLPPHTEKLIHSLEAASYPWTLEWADVYLSAYPEPTTLKSSHRKVGRSYSITWSMVLIPLPASPVI